MSDSHLKKIMVAVPVLDYRIDIEVMSALIAVFSTFGQGVVPYFLAGDSNIRHARNHIAHHFMKSDCDALVCIDADIIFSLQDFAQLLEQVGDEEVVVAPYARKIVGRPPVDFGLGFARIDRSAFQKLADWLTEDGEEMLHRYRLEGELAVDYYFDGATADMSWFSEDTGFWHWCHLVGVRMRREPRVRLGHIGRFVYGYPDQTPGLMRVEGSN